MEIAEILSAVGSVGFPIVMCIIIYYFMVQESKSHKEEVGELKNVLTETKEVIAGLKQLIQDKLQ